MVNMVEVLEKSITFGASDVHINVGMRPIFRKDTELFDAEFDVVTKENAVEMLLSLVGKEKYDKFEQTRDYDFSTHVPTGSRFRVNAHYQNQTIALSFRVISSEIPELESLHLPEVIAELTELPRGLVLVTGPTGSGKSTTLAAMINTINKKYRKRIITMEDPIEYMFTNDKSMIEQREIGDDSHSFQDSLKHALRQDPDILLVGEMRDLETIEATVTGAETGHLVFSTLHTVSAAQTIERIVDVYPAGQQEQIRTMLANTLKAVMSQTLFKRIDKPGMVPCNEILLCNAAVRNCIREGRIYEIPNIIETSKRLGMCSLDNSIAKAFFNGYIDRDEAVARSHNPIKMDKLLVHKRTAEREGLEV